MARARKRCRSARSDVDDHRGRAGRPLRDPAGRSPTATTPASIRGTTCTTWACARTSCGSAISTAWRRPARAATRPDGESHVDERTHTIRLRAGDARREDAARARRLRFGRRQVRRDERPDVGRPAPAVEALRDRGRAPCVPASACSTSRAAPAISRACSPRASARPAWWCTPTSTARCSPKAATSCSTAASRCRPSSATPRRCRFADRAFDVVSIAFGLRNVTRKERALAEMRRVLRPGGAALVLEFSRVAAPLAPAYDWYSFNVLPRLGKWIAERRGELPLSRRIDPRASGPGGAEADDGTGGLRPGRIPQPDRGRGRRRTSAACIDSFTTAASIHAAHRPAARHATFARAHRHQRRSR